MTLDFQVPPLDADGPNAEPKRLHIVLSMPVNAAFGMGKLRRGSSPTTPRTPTGDGAVGGDAFHEAAHNSSVQAGWSEADQARAMASALAARRAERQRKQTERAARQERKRAQLRKEQEEREAAAAAVHTFTLELPLAKTGSPFLVPREE